MFNEILHAVKDAGLDCLKIFPILFLVYLLLEYLTHKKQETFINLFKKQNKFGPFFGSIFGCIPQCGFSIVLADMFNHKLIGIGTLIAVFISTSDEAIPILLSYPNKILTILMIILVKFIFALFFGYLFYFIFSLLSFSQKQKHNLANTGASQNSAEYLHNHECIIDEHHTHTHVHEKDISLPCSCRSENIFLNALKHSLTILLYVFVANLVINFIFVFVGEDALIKALSVSPYLQIVIAPLIGLIPNCVSSVVLIELYLNGALIFPALIAGLSAGSGVGLIVLFKNKKNFKQNLFILFSLYFIGVLIGLTLKIIM